MMVNKKGNKEERWTDLVSRVIAGHITFTTVDAHIFIYQSLDLRKHGRFTDLSLFV